LYLICIYKVHVAMHIFKLCGILINLFICFLISFAYFFAQNCFYLMPASKSEIKFQAAFQ
jgi:outer membrane phospholipase A